MKNSRTTFGGMLLACTQLFSPVAAQATGRNDSFAESFVDCCSDACLVGPSGAATTPPPEPVKDGAGGGPALLSTGCAATNARANQNFPLLRDSNFIPITPNDDLGFYVVYSSRKSPSNPDVLGNNVGIFVFELYNNEVLVFGSGYGDRTDNPQSAYYSAARDASYVDDVIRNCMGKNPATLRIRFVAPHGHADHINPQFVRELKTLGYQIRDINYHQNDNNIVSPMDWTNADRAVFRTMTGGSNCFEPLRTLYSPLGRIWFYLRSGHTSGSIDLVLDVENDPSNRVLVLGSQAGGSCGQPSGVSLRLTPHGNVVVSDGEPEIHPIGCGLNPPNSIQILSGVPQIGSSMKIAIDLPTGAQSPGAVPLLSLSLASDEAYPCGTPVTNVGFQRDGELLISIDPSDLLDPLLGSHTWNGSPVEFDLLIPQDASLVGASIFCQGIFMDALMARQFSLTEGLHLRIGR